MELSSLPSISHKIFLKVKPEKVYQTLISEKEWNKWFTDRTTIEFKHDGTGEIKLRWTEFGVHKKSIEDGGRILAAVPNKLFKFQWCPGDSPTTITFQMTPYKEGTILVLEEEGYRNTKSDLKVCLACAAGWGEALTMLKMYLEYDIVVKEDVL
jgi:uncharacterized protein YndB with AHSA1/START domain